MGKEVIDVQFDNNPQGTFEAGQAVQGSVIITIDEKLKTEGIKVKMSGKARVRWTEGGGQNTRYYSGGERYHGEEILLKDHLANNEEMHAGTHTFPFRFQLRKEVPASFHYNHGVTGKVYYHIKVVVIKPWSFNITFKKPFTVFHGLDLNVQPDAVRERRNSKEKYICCCCCRSGPLSGSVHVPREGYVPGDTVVVSGEIENLSSRKMTKSLVALTRKYDFHATSKSRSVEKNLQEIAGPAIRSGGSYSCRETLTIPMEAEPSFLIGCNIIDIHYYAMVIADPAGPALDLKVPMEIVVGTIPHAAAVQQAGNTAGFSVGVPSAFSGPASAPPSYDQATANPSGVYASSTTFGLSETGGTATQGGVQGYDNFASAFTY